MSATTTGPAYLARFGASFILSHSRVRHGPAYSFRHADFWLMLDQVTLVTWDFTLRVVNTEYMKVYLFELNYTLVGSFRDFICVTQFFQVIF